MRWGIRFVLLAVALALAFPGSAGAFGPLSSFGEFGSGPGQLMAPKQIAIDSGGDLYVADSGNDRISIFAGDGAFQRTWTAQMDEPQDVAFEGGRVFVADSGNDRVDVFTAKGEFLSELGEGELTDPTGLAVDASTVYVADGGNERIAVFSTAGGPPTQIKPGFSFLPRDVIVGDDGNLFVADVANGRIDVFSEDGTFHRSFSETGSGALSGPVALAFDGAGGIYVADQAGKRVERFSEGGDFLGGFAVEPDVVGVVTACGGNVFAVEEGAARVVRFGEAGTPPPPCTPALESIVNPGVKLPSNRFRFAGLRRNRGNGFAVIFVRVPGPGKLTLNGRGFRRLSRVAARAKTVRLPIKPKVRLRHFLKQHGKGRIRVVVTFTPTGGIPRQREKVIVLRRRR